MKIKTFCTAKETINETKRQPMEWEKRFANDMSDKVSVSKIYKEPTQFNMQNDESGLLSYTIRKNKLKMDERPKHKTRNHQNPKGENRPHPQQLLNLTCFQRQGKKKQK